MTPTPDRIRAAVARTLEDQGIAPRRALRAAVRLVRGLALDIRDKTESGPSATLYNMRDRIAELLQERGLPEPEAIAVAGRMIDWLRKSWGGRTLTRQWWGFGKNGEEGMVNSEEIPLPFTPHPSLLSDPVKSKRGRELRAVVWGILALHPSPLTINRICFSATEIAAMVERDWATVYVPLGEDLDRQARDQEIYKAFDGLGRMEKCTALGISQSTAYERFRRMAADKERREQPGLF